MKNRMMSLIACLLALMLLGAGAAVSESAATMTLPASLTAIEAEAFIGDSLLEEVVLPGGLESIGASAFKGCSSLKRINLPWFVGSIGENAFAGCPNLTATVVEGSYAHAWCEDNHVNYDFAQLTPTPSQYFNVTMNYPICITGYNGPDTDVVIPAWINGPVGAIGSKAFYDQRLTSVHIPEGVTEIGNNAFFDNEKLRHVSLPSSLKVIDHFTFMHCDLAEIRLPEGLEHIGHYAFADNAHLKALHIPASVSFIGQGAFGICASLSSITIDPGNTAYKLVDDVLYTQDGTSLLLYLPSKAGARFVVPENVTEIQVYAFSCAANLTEVVLPEKLTFLSSGAFRDCTSLVRIEIPQGCTNIGNDTFDGCTALKEVVLPEGPTAIPRNCFLGCSSLESLTLPESVTSIEMYAFMNCTSLKSINLPAGVNSINSYAFYNCTSLTATVVEGSYAHTWCQNNGVNYTFAGAQAGE
ncbi:MAG: leucine-rich repeat domain-containing protein [Candidatus Ventricola sp.]